MEELFKAVEKNEALFKDFLKEIVLRESYTPDKAAVDALGEYIKVFAEAQGFYVQVRPFEKAGNGLLVSWNEDAALPAVTLTGHMDTVHPRGSFAEPIYREEDGKIYGPGVSDMKGGLAMGLLVMKSLKDSGWKDRPLKFIFVPDEELSEGLSGEAGKDFIRDNARGRAAAITLEPSSDPARVTVARKGSIRYRVYVKGKAAHAGSSYAKGISAIKEAAHKILAIEAASDPEQITYNCGLIKGGTAPNTVPEEADFTLYNRYWEMSQRQEVKDHVEGIIAHSYIPGTVSTFEVIGERWPMDKSEGNLALCEHIAKVSEKYGFGPKHAHRQAGGSDASYTAMAGVPSVCSMGPVGGGAHTLHEYMDATSFVPRAKLLAAVIAELPAGFGV